MKVILAGQCPKCEDTLQYGNWEFLDGEIFWNVRCDREGCGWSGVECYETKFTGFYVGDNWDEFTEATEV